VTERQVIEAALAQFDAQWEVLHPGSRSPANTAQAGCVPWTTSNEPFTPDQLGVLQAWARITINHSTRVQATMGDAPTFKDDVRGQIIVQLFAPVGKGGGLLADLAKDVRSTLRGRFSGLSLHAGATQPGGEDGRWAMCVVVIPFRYEDV
jgi:hypothetical protein